MIASHFSQHLLNNWAGPAQMNCAVRMITGMGITQGSLLLCLYEGSSLSCSFPMEWFPARHGSNCPLQAQRKNTFTCRITQNLFDIHLIPMWLNITGYLKITVAQPNFPLSQTLLQKHWRTWTHCMLRQLHRQAGERQHLGSHTWPFAGPTWFLEYFYNVFR